MSRGLIVVAGVGVAGAVAYRQGYLPQLDPLVAQARQLLANLGGGGGGGGGDPFAPASWQAAADQRDAESQAIRNAMGGETMPILGASETVTVNKFEAALRENWGAVQPWARANVGWAAAILSVENGKLDPKAKGDGGKAHGLFQVHVPTAETCARAGYTRYQPTADVLSTVAGGIYFGTAEMDRLSKIPGKGSDRDWLIAAYNGGAGWEGESAAYQRARRAYRDRVKRAFVRLYGNGGERMV